MAYVIEMRNGVSGGHEFMYFIDDGTIDPVNITFNKPTFELQSNSSNSKGGVIRIYERGVLYPRAFYFQDFIEIDGDTPTNMDDAYNKLNILRRTML